MSRGINLFAAQLTNHREKSEGGSNESDQVPDCNSISHRLEIPSPPRLRNEREKYRQLDGRTHLSLRIVNKHNVSSVLTN